MSTCAYLLGDGDRPLGVFTGGSLIVGSAARTDLLGADRTRELTDAQYRSLQRLSAAAGPDRGVAHARRGIVLLGPARRRPHLHHRPGAGDEPAAGAAGCRRVRRRRCWARWAATRPTSPASGRSTAAGPALLDPGAGLPAVLPVPQVRTLRDAAPPCSTCARSPTTRPDTSRRRCPSRCATQFATWLGWLVAPDSPVVVVRNPDQDPAEIAWQALKIGYERLVGELDGGMPAWVAAGQPIAATELVTPEAIQDRRVIDVRQRGEFRGGHLPGAMHIELGALAATVGTAARPPHRGDVRARRTRRGRGQPARTRRTPRPRRPGRRTRRLGRRHRPPPDTD